MITKLARLFFSLAILVGIAAAFAPAAGAQGFSTLPIKPFPSAKLTITGSLTIGANVLNLKGSGSQKGDLYKFNLDVTPAAGGPTQTLEQLQIGQMYYFRLTGDPTWYSIDLSKTPGNVPNIQSSIPGINGFNPNGGQRTYDAATNFKNMGSELILGNPSTKYEGQVDLNKLYLSLGASQATAAQVAAVSKMNATIWVGDKDAYIYQTRIVLNTLAPAGPGGSIVPVVVDFTLTNSNFGIEVSVVAPAGSVVYGSQPAIAPTAKSVPTPGMPSTGAADLTGIVVLLLAALGLISLGLLLTTRPRVSES